MAKKITGAMLPILVLALGLGACGSQAGEGLDQAEQGEPTVATEVAALNTNLPYIGFIPAGDPADPSVAACPDGTNGQLVGIRMDDEDSSNNDQLTVGSQNYSGHNASAGGLIHSSSPRRAGGNTWIKYCPRYTPSLPTLSADYAVLSASNVCPANSYRFSRRFDNEDGANHNATVGDISPNTTDTNGGASNLFFCFVPGTSGAASWNNIFDGSVIFTNGAVATKGAFRTDDEDDGNNNSYWSSATQYSSRMQALVSGGSNTTFQFGTNSQLDVVDLGTTSDCGNPDYKIGFKCSYSTSGTFEGCKPIGGVDDYWAFAKDMFCKW